MVRDQALALSGLLSRKIGGPSRLPAAARRALAGRVQRPAHLGRPARATTVPPRALHLLAADRPVSVDGHVRRPSREICTIRRIRTNTPLQAFVTLNDPVYVEAAQALARRIVSEGGTTVEDRASLRPAALPGRPPASGAGRALIALL